MFQIVMKCIFSQW